MVNYGQSEPESLARVLHYLSQEESAYENELSTPPAWRMLKASLASDQVFNNYADRLIKDTKTAENDVAFRAIMNIMYTQMMNPTNEPLSHGSHQFFDVSSLAQVSGLIGFARAWTKIPPASQQAIIKAVPTIVANQQVFLFAAELSTLAKSVGGTMVVVS